MNDQIFGPLSECKELRKFNKEDFSISKHCIGKGKMGRVCIAILRKTFEKFAIKFVDLSKLKTERDILNLQREIKIGSSLRHKNIVRTFGYIANIPNKVGIVMEYVEGGELYELLDNMGVMSEKESYNIFKQVLSAIVHCHSKSVVHRDIKLENILYTKDYKVKLADFGLSHEADETMRSRCGTKYYCAPEVLSGNCYSESCDVWSLGIMLFALSHGFLPFDHDNDLTLMQSICLGTYKFPPFISQELRQLIAAMLNKKSNSRIKAFEICSSSWMQKMKRLTSRGSKRRSNSDKVPNTQSVMEAQERNRRHQIKLMDKIKREVKREKEFVAAKSDEPRNNSRRFSIPRPPRLIVPERSAQLRACSATRKTCKAKFVKVIDDYSGSESASSATPPSSLTPDASYNHNLASLKYKHIKSMKKKTAWKAHNPKLVTSRYQPTHDGRKVLKSPPRTPQKKPHTVFNFKQTGGSSGFSSTEEGDSSPHRPRTRRTSTPTPRNRVHAPTIRTTTRTSRRASTPTHRAINPTPRASTPTLKAKRDSQQTKMQKKHRTPLYA